MGRDGGGVRAASATSIEISFQYAGRRCRERIALEPTPANLKRAEQHKASIEHAIAIGAFDYSSTFPKSPNGRRFKSPIDRTPLDRFLPEWLERKKPRIKASTYDGYRKLVTGPLYRLFGATPLGDLTTTLIEDKLATLNVSNKRLMNIQSCLGSALDDAVHRKLLTANPLLVWRYAKLDAGKTHDPEADIDVFSAQEQSAMLAVMQPQIRNLFQTAFWTGMRPSELVALRWSDIDWVHGRLFVVRALTQAATSTESTKTKAGTRRVKLLTPALNALKAQKAHTFLADREVFFDPRHNAPFTGDQALRKSFWIPALRKAGVRYRNPYQTRHTYASMMLSAGEHPMWVAGQMGHTDWSMIVRVYGHWISPDEAREGARAEEAFAKQGSCQSDNDNIMPTTAL